MFNTIYSQNYEGIVQIPNNNMNLKEINPDKSPKIKKNT